MSFRNVRDMSDPRLDAAEGVFFERQLESIDTRLFEAVYEDLKAREYIPTAEGIDALDDVYTYYEGDQVGEAKIIAGGADDLPRADVFESENKQGIKLLGASYGYNVMEIRKAMRLGTNLDQRKANAARRAIDEKIDNLLAFGDANHGLGGFLNNANVDSSYSLTATFAAAAAGTDTQRKLLIDEIMALADTRWITTKEKFGSYTLLLPSSQYAILNRMPFGDNADRTAMQYILQNSERITSIQSWTKLSDAGSGGATRAVLYPRDERVVAGIVPMEFTTLPVQQENLSYKVPCMAKCGGTVVRYPVAMAYVDGV